MADEELDRRIKELEAQLKERELRDRSSGRALASQSLLVALPIVLTVGLGFIASYYQAQHQFEEQRGNLITQGRLNREAQERADTANRAARNDESKRSYNLQEREFEAQLERQKNEFAANAAAASARFAQEQLTLRSQHAADQLRQTREFDQSMERQRRQNEFEIILKANEVPTTLSPEQQDVARARNLLWFAENGYVRMPAALLAKVRDTAKVAPGQSVAVPVLQSAGSTANLDLIARNEGFVAKPVTFGGRSTIGYGHALTEEERRSQTVRIGKRSVDISNGISEADARELLRIEVAPYYAAIDRLVKVPLTPSQRDALASFTLSVGVGYLERSQLLKRLNAGDYDAVPQEMMKLTAVNGVEFRGLRERREAEAALWRMAN